MSRLSSLCHQHAAASAELFFPEKYYVFHGKKLAQFFVLKYDIHFKKIGVFFGGARDVSNLF